MDINLKRKRLTITGPAYNGRRLPSTFRIVATDNGDGTHRVEARNGRGVVLHSLDATSVEFDRELTATDGTTTWETADCGCGG